MAEFVEIKAKKIGFDFTESEEETVDWKSKTIVGAPRNAKNVVKPRRASSDMTDSEEDSPSKSKKTCGSSQQAKYDASRKFRPAWTEQYSWIKNRDGRAFCVACKKFVFNNIAHIRKHGQNVSHCKRLKETKKVLEANLSKSEPFIKLEIDQLLNEPKSQNAEEYIDTYTLSDNLIVQKDQEKTTSANRMDKSLRECQKIVEIWATKLHKMDTTQQMLTERFINEIIFEGQMGTLHRNSLQLNIIETIYQAHNEVTENSTL